ncbi:MAG TPA: CPBP family intramembrane glutamic endopeptidase, partial [Chryseolinea sp.]|nr:CPBP family intramembrane glutamic endopeptidase [Chryseolinea sp.]
EIVFRGLIQNELYRNTGNIHLSIWIAATLFSAFHLQFFGFVPRLFMGALIGYLYYWSANLSFAIIAHFINNGLILLTIYLFRLGIIETPKSAPIALVCVSVVVGVALSLYFFNYFKDRRLSMPYGVK